MTEWKWWEPWAAGVGIMLVMGVFVGLLLVVPWLVLGFLGLLFVHSLGAVVLADGSDETI